MKVLGNQFAGEDNSTRNISKTFHYKNEISVASELFLIKCWEMYNIYEK